MKKYEVRWFEEHEMVVKANNKEEAIELAKGYNPELTLCGSKDTEVRKVKK